MVLWGVARSNSGRFGGVGVGVSVEFGAGGDYAVAGLLVVCADGWGRHGGVGIFSGGN